MLAAELGRCLAAGGIFCHQPLQFPVQAGGLELGQRLVERVLILLSEKLP